MSILQQIEDNLKSAMRNKDEEQLRTLRMLKSDIMYEKAKSDEELTDETLITIISRAAKKRKEAIEEYQKAGRTDLQKKEEAELSIISTYLPQQMSEKEIEELIDNKLAESGQVTQKDFGKIMGPLMKEIKGKADGNIVKKILALKLEKL